jgi:hypothetical protein
MYQIYTIFDGILKNNACYVQHLNLQMNIRVHDVHLDLLGKLAFFVYASS